MFLVSFFICARPEAAIPFKEKYLTFNRKFWLLIGVGLGTIGGCGGTSPPAAPAVIPNAKSTAVKDLATLSDQELEAHIGSQVKSFCSDCHVIPSGRETPREEWRKEVEQAFSFHRNSPRKDEPTPDFKGVVAYFERKAIPDSEYSVVPLGAVDRGELRFENSTIQLDPNGKLPAVAGMTWVPSGRGAGGFLLVCDMRSGGLYRVDFPNGRKSPLIKSLVDPGSIYLSNPCHVEPCDLDSDGKEDLFVADLGTFHPADELKGRIVWLKATSPDSYRPKLIPTS